WKTAPSIAARSIARRSPALSWSRREARSTWIDSGTGISDRSPASRQPPREGRRWAPSISIETSSSTNSGMPSAEAWTRRRTSPATPLPSRFSSSTADSSSDSGSSRIVVAFHLPPPQAGRRSSRSGRARQTSRTGPSRMPSARCSTRSRKVGSAQFTSSKTTTSGFVRESDSSSRRIPQKPSSAATGSSSRPTSAAARRAARGAASSPASASSMRASPTRRVAVDDAGGLLDDLQRRPEGDPLAVGQAGAGDDPRTVAEAAQRLAHEPRLADARRAEHGEQVAGALAHGPRERPLEQGQLALAADHRRVEAPRPRRRSREDGDEPVRAHRLALPLQRQRLEPLRPDRVTGEPVGALGEEDLARLGRRLEPLGDVDRVAGGERVAERRVSGDHLAARDADPDGDAEPEGGFQLDVQALDRLLELDGGPQRAVVVQEGDAEDGHDGVADELLDRAAVPLEHGARLLVVA